MNGYIPVDAAEPESSRPRLPLVEHEDVTLLKRDTVARLEREGDRSLRRGPRGDTTPFAAVDSAGHYVARRCHIRHDESASGSGPILVTQIHPITDGYRFTDLAASVYVLSRFWSLFVHGALLFRRFISVYFRDIDMTSTECRGRPRRISGFVGV